jgi:hypothetical protein
MALKVNIIKLELGFSGSLSANDVHVQVISVAGGKNMLNAVVAGTKDGINVLNKSYAFVPNLDGRNFIAQAYEHLKTLPEFAGATDC